VSYARQREFQSPSTKGVNEMNTPEIVSLIAEEADITKKTATKVLQALVNTIHSSLKEPRGRIRISDLGTFRVIEMDARNGVNPRTGEPMTISSMRLPRFTASKSLKATLRGTR
jgi:DNA-binding protein HU-beta